MKRFWITLVMMLSIQIASAQTTISAYWTNTADIAAGKPEDIIPYSRSRPLIWSDFRGTPEGNGMEAALTASGFGYSLSMRNSGTQASINIAVYCYFNKRGSWVKPKGLTNYILNHEQRHFDITYIAAYDFLQRIRTLSLSTKNCSEVLQNVYKVFSTSLTKMQTDYDEQTKHGIDTAMQAKWDAFITERLKGIME